MDIAELGYKVDSSGLAQGEAALKRTEDAAKRTETATEKLERRFGSMTKLLGGVVAGLFSIHAAMRVLAATVREIAAFEQSMSGVQAVTRATRVELEAMSSVARQLGATTRFSASEAAEGMRFLGMAGFNTSQIIAAMPATLQLATAGALDLGRAADIASNVLSAFQMEARDTGRVADVLATAAASANTDINQLAEALKPVGGIAASLNIPLEDTTAALSTMAQVGRQGSEAGIGLRRVLSVLINPTSQARAEFARLNLSMEKLDPRTNRLSDVIRRLAESGMEADAAFRAFGDRGAPALIALTSQTAELERLGGVMDASAGAAARMAKEMGDNLRGDTAGLRSSVSELMLKLGDAGLLKLLRSVTQGLTGFFRTVGDGADVILTVAGVIAGVLVARSGAAVLAWLGRTSIAWVMNTQQAIAYQMALARMAGASLAAATASRALAGALALVGGPLGLLVLAAGALTVAVMRGAAANRERIATERESTRSLAEMTAQMREARLEQERMARAASAGVGVEQLTAFEELKRAQEELISVTSELDRIQGQALGTSNMLGPSTLALERRQAELRDQVDESTRVWREHGAELAMQEDGFKQLRSAYKGLLDVDLPGSLSELGERLGFVTQRTEEYAATSRFGTLTSEDFEKSLADTTATLQLQVIELEEGQRAALIYKAMLEAGADSADELTESLLAQIDAVVALTDRVNKLSAARRSSSTIDRESARAARDAERERQQIAEAGLGAADQLNQTLRDQAGVLGGPGVRAANAYVDAMMGLLKVEGDLAAAGMLTADAVRGLSQAREDAGLIYQANLDAIEAERTQAQRMIEDLEFERELLSMTNTEREVAIALRYAAADATQAELDKIRELVIGNRELREAEAERAAGLDVVRRASMGLFDDIIEGGKSAKKIIIDFAKTVLLEFARIQAQKLIMDAMGSPGTSGGGSYGDAIGSALGLIFGGGRYLGGDVRRDRLYQVGERNVPEIANIGGRQFMIPGDRGRVDPLPQAAPAPAPVVNQKIYVSGNASPGTARQIELEAAKRQRIVAGRFGG